MPICAKSKVENLKLGFDNFSIRARKWKASKLLDYAATLKVDSILFSDLHVYESLETPYLKELKAKADDLGLEIQVGTGSICPSAKSFKKDFGTAEEHLGLLIKVARTLGSNAARCYQGTAADRKTSGGLKPHIANTIAVCKKVKELAIESDVKIAIENHAGDLSAYQLRQIIEEAGPEYVGATIDSGNATWTYDEPLRHLKILGPYIASSGIRDSLVWKTEKGLNARWTAMGEGHVEWKAYFSHWQEVCPQVPVQLEIISGLTKTMPENHSDAYKKIYHDIQKDDYKVFEAMAEAGAVVGKIPEPMKVKRKELFSADYMQQQLEASIAYCQNELGLGRKVNSA